MPRTTRAPLHLPAYLPPSLSSRTPPAPYTSYTHPPSSLLSRSNLISATMSEARGSGSLLRGASSARSPARDPRRAIAATTASAGAAGEPSARWSKPAARRRYVQPRPRRDPATRHGSVRRLPHGAQGRHRGSAGREPEADCADPPRPARNGCPEVDDLDTWPCPAVERRHELGFRYLVTALAGRGFVAVSINVNAADTNGWGEPRENRTEQILRRFLDRLAVANGGGANGFGVPLAGRIDFSRLGLIGHSQRGARSVVIARNRARSPGPVDAGRGPIRAMLLLAPVYVPRKVPRGTAFALVLPQCDNDVVNLEGLGYFDRIGREQRARTAALVYLRRANHNFFNAALADEGGHNRPGVRASFEAPRESRSDRLAGALCAGLLPGRARSRAGRRGRQPQCGSPTAPVCLRPAGARRRSRSPPRTASWSSTRPGRPACAGPRREDASA